MISKKQQLLNAIEVNDTKLALRIAKDFRIDFTAEQSRILQIAYESHDPSKERYYSSLGIDTIHYRQTAHSLLQQFKQAKS